MDELRNFNDIFRENVTYHNIKNHKKPVYPLSKRCIFGKPQKGECRIDTHYKNIVENASSYLRSFMEILTAKTKISFLSRRSSNSEETTNQTNR